MAAGELLLATDLSRAIVSVLKPDWLIQRYAPGGVFDESPPPAPSFQSCVRFWLQAPGTEVKRQDGQLGRVASYPTYIITMLDRQGVRPDYSYGTIGGALDHPQAYMDLGAARIYTLLHGKPFVYNGVTYLFNARCPYKQKELVAQGQLSVMNGWWFGVTAQ